jgi:hypothetical protein
MIRFTTNEGRTTICTSTPFHKFCGKKWQFEIVLYFIRFEAALKSEFSRRLMRFVNMSNYQNHAQNF